MRPTGPAPKTATLSPDRKPEISIPCQPVGKISSHNERLKQTTTNEGLTSEKNKVSLMLLASRQFESVKVRIWNSDILRLTTSVRAHGDITVGASCKARVDTSTESSSALFTVTAATIGNIEGHDDAVSFLEKGDAFAELLDYSHILMACEVSVSEKIEQD